MVVLANRQKERNKVKEDVFNAREDFVELEGIGFFQAGVMYGPDRRRRAACTMCYGRIDEVSYIMDGKAFNGRGDLLGTIDDNNELIPGTAPTREEIVLDEEDLDEDETAESSGEEEEVPEEEQVAVAVPDGKSVAKRTRKRKKPAKKPTKSDDLLE